MSTPHNQFTTTAAGVISYWTSLISACWVNSRGNPSTDPAVYTSNTRTLLQQTQCVRVVKNVRVCFVGKDGGKL